MPRLRVIEGPHRGEVFELGGHRVLAGRDLNNAVYLPDGLVSRHHAEFVQTAHGYIVRDLDSTNGTYVNDQPVTETDLKDGDIVRLADVVMRYEAAANPAPPPPSDAKQPAATTPTPTASASTTAPPSSSIPKLRRDTAPKPAPTTPASVSSANPDDKAQPTPRLYSSPPNPSKPPEEEILIVEAPPRKIAPFLLMGAVGVLTLIAGYTLDANALRFWGLVLLILGGLCTFRDWSPLPPKTREL